MLHRLAAALLLTATLTTCSRFNDLKNKLLRVPPVVQYTDWMRTAAEAGDAAATAWLARAESALRDTVQLLTPFQSTGYLAADYPAADGYRLRLREGERLRLELATELDSLNIFVDLFRVNPSSVDTSYERLRSLDRLTPTADYEVETTGRYQVRVQAELAAAGLYELTVVKEPVLGFPVAGKSNDAIWSFWGDARGGGTRKHEGIDIFAARGTPVVAVSDGWVTSVRDAGLGGKQVWVRDAARGLSFYYAHLDSQLVETGRRVRLNDTLGLVGNTGNARNTRPHLHFGIYRGRGGAVDPLPFVYQHTRETTPFSGDTSLLRARWVETIRRNVRLRAAPTPKAATRQTLPARTALRVTAANGDWFRVRLPVDGTAGYVLAKELTSAERAISKPE